MRKLIILNAPPLSGKDYVTGFLDVRYKMAFADYVKHDTHKHYGLDDLAADHFEKRKAIPQLTFDNKTPREAYIHVAEDIMKPKYGRSYYGIRLAKWLSKQKHLEPDVTDVVMDGGFEGEVVPFINIVEGHYDRIYLIRIHVDNDEEFKSDSRRYLDIHKEMPEVIDIDIFNDKTDRFPRTLINLLK